MRCVRCSEVCMWNAEECSNTKADSNIIDSCLENCFSIFITDVARNMFRNASTRKCAGTGGWRISVHSEKVDNTSSYTYDHVYSTRKFHAHKRVQTKTFIYGFLWVLIEHTLGLRQQLENVSTHEFTLSSCKLINIYISVNSQFSELNDFFSLISRHYVTVNTKKPFNYFCINISRIRRFQAGAKNFAFLFEINVFHFLM